MYIFFSEKISFCKLLFILLEIEITETKSNCPKIISNKNYIETSRADTASEKFNLKHKNNVTV